MHTLEVLCRAVTVPTRQGAGGGRPSPNGPEFRATRIATMPSSGDSAASEWAQLRTAVSSYARALRGEGAPAERMLILVKTTVVEASVGRFDGDAKRELMDLVVRWSIEAYYHAE